MSAAKPITPEPGTVMGPTDWLEMTQDRVTAFGGVTLDFDPHHIDPRQAKNGPFGKAVAQGFLTLSLLTYFAGEIPEGEFPEQNINYGFNKVRFIRPAGVGERLRATFTCRESVERSPNMTQVTFDVLVESDLDGGTPVLAAEWLAIVVG